MGEVLFNITMGTGLALSIDKNNPGAGGQLLLEPANASDPDQQWTFVFMPAVQGCALFNPGRNVFAAAASQDRGPVILYGPNMPITTANTWQVLGDSRSSIRMVADDNLNLNALGDDWPVGTKIGVWSWSGGDDNEVWTSKVVAT